MSNESVISLATSLRPESPLVALMAGTYPGAPVHALRGFRFPDDPVDPIDPATENRFQLTERPFLEIVNLRGDAALPAFADAVRGVLGVALPTQANTMADGADYSVCWMGPDEWLAISHSARASLLAQALGSVLRGQYASAVDVGSGYTALDLSGPHARAVVQKGCPLELHPRVFGPGQCAQSHFFKTTVLLWSKSPTHIGLLIRRSFADHCTRLLLDAAGEFLPGARP